MKNFKKDFPIFENNKNLVFLDNASSTQKPKIVIDWISEYYSNNYSNIHRWNYDISMKSEELYNQSKKEIAKLIWAASYKEIIYTYNSTYAINLLCQSIKKTALLKKWDKVLLSISEHHANIVPFLILKQEIWIEIEYIDIWKDYFLDFDDLKSKLDEKVKLVSLSLVSNITWSKLKKEFTNYIKEQKNKREDLIVIYDASQSIPHFKIDVEKLWADAIFFTAHKFMAETWIWVLYGKENFLNNLKASFSWWWAISKVETCSFTENTLPYKLEPWTPHISWAISILKSIDYFKSIWWYETVEKVEKNLSTYFLEKVKKIKYLEIIWTKEYKDRIWIFSFNIKWSHSHDISEILADQNICIRSGQHCCEPLLNRLKIKHTSRISFYLYNEKSDIDSFFEVLDKHIK